MDEVKSMVKSCIVSRKGGMPLTEINGDYRELVGSYIPYKKFGFSSLEEFIKSIEEIEIFRSRDGTVMLEAADPKTAHISAMVAKQRKPPTKPVKKRLIDMRRPSTANNWGRINMCHKRFNENILKNEVLFTSVNKERCWDAGNQVINKKCGETNKLCAGEKPESKLANSQKTTSTSDKIINDLIDSLKETKIHDHKVHDNTKQTSACDKAIKDTSQLEGSSNFKSSFDTKVKKNLLEENESPSSRKESISERLSRKRLECIENLHHTKETERVTSVESSPQEETFVVPVKSRHERRIHMDDNITVTIVNDLCKLPTEERRAHHEKRMSLQATTHCLGQEEAESIHRSRKSLAQYPIPEHLEEFPCVSQKYRPRSNRISKPAEYYKEEVYLRKTVRKAKDDSVFHDDLKEHEEEIERGAMLYTKGIPRRIPEIFVEVKNEYALDRNKRLSALGSI